MPYTFDLVPFGGRSLTLFSGCRYSRIFCFSSMQNSGFPDLVIPNSDLCYNSFALHAFLSNVKKSFSSFQKKCILLQSFVSSKNFAILSFCVFVRCIYSISNKTFFCFLTIFPMRCSLKANNAHIYE